ncbi:MAG: hypothetical protein QG673_1096 [Pseudomonadota bacterium]|nr:hypothetical protein [Pseudomonadota bacterium]
MNKIKNGLVKLFAVISFISLLLLSGCNSGTSSSTGFTNSNSVVGSNSYNSSSVSSDLGTIANSELAIGIKTSANSSVIFKSISSGINSFCALDSSGHVWCWGNNSAGQLGNGSKTNESFPTQVSIDSSINFKYLVGFNYSYCAIDTNNQLYCWGGGGSGQIGDGSGKDAAVPTKVSTQNLPWGVYFKSISIGASNICGVGSDSMVYCWGSNQYGQVGIGDATVGQNILIPTPIVSKQVLDSRFTEVKINYYGSAFVCALSINGDIYCWGYGGHGEIGNGYNNNVYIPTLVKVKDQVDVEFAHLAPGMGNGSCAITTAGNAYCWGYNQSGEGANGSYSNTNVATPVNMPSAETFVSITTSTNTACAVTNKNNSYCWGYGESGELGNGNTSKSNQPVKTLSTTAITSISSSYYITATLCEIDVNGKVYCWGYGVTGSIGNGAYPFESVASKPESIAIVDQTKKFTQVAITGNSSTVCAVDSLGEIYCWGSGMEGQLGGGVYQNTSIPTLVRMDGISPKITKLVATRNLYANTFCAAYNIGKAYCWGYGKNGEIGNGSNSNQYVAKLVSLTDDSNIIDIAAADDTICIANNKSSGGNAYCWGYGANGQLGNGDIKNSNTPKQVLLFNDVFTKLVATSETFCGLVSSGTIYCWGHGEHGEIGDGNGVSTSIPKPINASGIKFTSLMVGGTDTFCANSTGGVLYCWGYNGSGQVGSGSSSSSSSIIKSPEKVGNNFKLITNLSLFGGGSALTATDGNFCGITSPSYYVSCWGLGVKGQIGNGSYTNQSLPQQAKAGPGAFSGMTFFDIAGGESSICAVGGDYHIYCWGYGSQGQMGNGTSGNAAEKNSLYLPVNMPANVLFGRVYSNIGSFCAVSTDNLIYCWGNGADGQLGNGSSSSANATVPTMVSYANADFSNDAADITAIVGVSSTYCALNSVGNIYCWGYGLNGENAAGSYKNTTQPTPISVVNI